WSSSSASAAPRRRTSATRRPASSPGLAGWSPAAAGSSSRPPSTVLTRKRATRRAGRSAVSWKCSSSARSTRSSSGTVPEGTRRLRSSEPLPAPLAPPRARSRVAAPGGADFFRGAPVLQGAAVEGDLTLARTKEDVARDLLRSLGSVLVAYSGGVDSSYLLWLARDVLGSRAVAFTAVSAAVPADEP